jgi:hypothetical protein
MPEEKAVSSYRKWKDFVSYPLDPERVRTSEQRLDVSMVMSPDDPQYDARQGCIITQSLIVSEDDRFEAMSIDDGGNVTIWTKKRVWGLFRFGGMEKLKYLPRHPDEES